VESREKKGERNLGFFGGKRVLTQKKIFVGVEKKEIGCSDAKKNTHQVSFEGG